MSSEACDALYERIVRLAPGQDELVVVIRSGWLGNIRWANNDVTTMGDVTDHYVTIQRGLGISFETNQFDNASLARGLAQLDYRLRYRRPAEDRLPLPGPQHYERQQLFFDDTANFVAADRSRTGRALAKPVETAGLRAAGFLAVTANSAAVYNTNGLRVYGRWTNAQYSVTVRNAKETGSGWAGVDGNDWSHIDAQAITERAQHKCLTSADPRAVEPGRYVAILEAQAVHDLMQHAILGVTLDRITAETSGPYHLARDESKLGHRILDPRISVTTDPLDPDCGTVPFVVDGWSVGEPIPKTTWITNGVLTDLAYDRRYALNQLGRALPNPTPAAYRMSGGTATVDEMIASTKRGVLVTRLSRMRVIDSATLTVTGVTRDGLWLVEDGKVTYAIKNFRFNESPLFVFNAIEQLGVPVRVFSPDAPAVVPPVKVRDFNFTALADAV
jgi:predicted Zn-dependent protease